MESSKVVLQTEPLLVAATTSSCMPNLGLCDVIGQCNDTSTNNTPFSSPVCCTSPVSSVSSATGLSLSSSQTKLPNYFNLPSTPNVKPLMESTPRLHCSPESPNVGPLSTGQPSPDTKSVNSNKETADHLATASDSSLLTDSDGRSKRRRILQVIPPAASEATKAGPVLKSKRSKQTKRKRHISQEKDVLPSKTQVICNYTDPVTGKTTSTGHFDFFGRDVEVFTAVCDATKQPIFRASTVAKKYRIPTNQLAMYLSRRRNLHEGIFQATGFDHKPTGRSGLKVGGYFLSLAACKRFDHFFTQQHVSLASKLSSNRDRPKTRSMRQVASRDTDSSSSSNGTPSKRTRKRAHLDDNALLLTNGTQSATTSAPSNTGSAPSSSSKSTSLFQHSTRALGDSKRMLKHMRNSRALTASVSNTPPLPADILLSAALDLERKQPSPLKVTSTFGVKPESRSPRLGSIDSLLKASSSVGEHSPVSMLTTQYLPSSSSSSLPLSSSPLMYSIPPHLISLGPLGSPLGSYFFLPGTSQSAVAVGLSNLPPQSGFPSYVALPSAQLPSPEVQKLALSRLNSFGRDASFGTSGTGGACGTSGVGANSLALPAIAVDQLSPDFLSTTYAAFSAPLSSTLHRLHQMQSMMPSPHQHYQQPMPMPELSNQAQPQSSMAFPTPSHVQQMHQLQNPSTLFASPNFHGLPFANFSLLPSSSMSASSLAMLASLSAPQFTGGASFANVAPSLTTLQPSVSASLSNFQSLPADTNSAAADTFLPMFHSLMERPASLAVQRFYDN